MKGNPLLVLMVVVTGAVGVELLRIDRQQQRILDNQRSQAEGQPRRPSQPPESDADLNARLDKAPNDAGLHAQRGELLFNQAYNLQQSGNLTEAMQLYGRSAADYEQAVTNETNSEKEADDRQMFASAAYNFAANAVNSADASVSTLKQARLYLDKAGPLVQTSDPTLYQQIQTLLGRLRN